MSIYHHNRTRSAFTLIELLIVIAIIVIIVVVVMMNFLGRRNTVDLANAAAQVTALLRQAQSASMAQESGASWTVQFQNATNTAPFYALISSVNGVSSTVGYYRLPNTVAYITSTLPLGSSLTVPFSQISGGTATSTNIGLYLISDPSQQETISISSLGAVSVIAPCSASIACGTSCTYLGRLLANSLESL